MQSSSAHERDLHEDSYSSPQKGSVGEQVEGPFSSEIATTSTATPPVSSLSPVLSIPHRTPSTVPHSAKPYAFSSKRKQAAHRARVLSLSKQLTTRLQYAAFKVEHGWSKQTLSEVENLYYRHRFSNQVEDSPSASSAVKRSQAPNVPTTPSPASRISPHARTKLADPRQQLEPLGGLVTPPASGNTFPSMPGKFNDAARTSPSLGATRGVAQTPPGGAHSWSNAQSGRSYADFWSKMGVGNAREAQ